MQIPHLSDEQQLWRAFKQGDRDAFGDIYTRYADALLAYGFHIAKDKTIVEDAIQELFIDLWRLKANLSDTSDIKYYLFKSLKNKIVQLMDREMVLARPIVNQEQTDASMEEQMIGTEQWSEQQHLLSKGLAFLPERQQKAIHLRFFANLNTREMADKMDMNEQSVRNLLQRALQKLRAGFPVLIWLCQIIFCIKPS